MLRWVCCLALVAVALAGTTNRRPVAPVTTQQAAGITSLTDKGNKRKAMEHVAFANAGRSAGTEIWRIENFEPVPVPARDFGKFYKGDSYIVLKTTADRKGQLSWDIHYWLGVGTSQDEAGAAAILTVGLDDKFNGAAVQHREVQGHESTQFMGYFQPAIRYVDGGHASGFSHVTTNAGAEKRLFQVKGKRNVRVRQVDPLISSMNKGDCFILDVNHDIYVYVGENAKRVERLKAISVANQIRDQDHNGRARVEIIDEFSSERDTEKFFTELGSGSRDVVPEATAGGDDQTFERGEETSVTLYEISDATGSLKATPLAKPYKQEQLKPQECYILDTVSGSIYVWVGKQSNEKEKTEAMAKAQQFLTTKNYPSWVHVSRIPQGTEPATFKQYFTTWRDVGMAHNRLVRSLSDEELYASDEETATKRARIIGKTGAARGFMPDQGDGHITLYRIEKQELKKVYDSESGAVEGHKFGQLYQGDSYVLQYEYRTEDHKRGYIIYFWLGKDSTQDEQAAAAINTAALDNQLSGAAQQVRVPQGAEPKHFLKIFKGRLITLLGGKASGFRNSNQRDSYDDDGVRLFQVSGTSAGVDMRAEQVEEKASSLDEDDVFILETPSKVYVWHGPGSTSEERSEAVEFVRALFGEREFETVEAGAEPSAFWSYLGGAPASIPAASWRNRLAARVGATPRLFEASVNTANLVTFEEFADYKQEDLSDEAVYVLDTMDELYVWLGREAPEHEKKSTNTIVEQYLRRYGEGRHALSTVVIVVKQGLEPRLFQNLFDEWDAEMWRLNRSCVARRFGPNDEPHSSDLTKQKSYDATKAAVLANNEI